MMNRLFNCAAAAFAASLSLAMSLMACQNDPYSAGDGSLSYMRADFVEAFTAGAKRLTHVVTDDGYRLTLSPAADAEWATAADSVYRALLYYNVPEGGVTEGVEAEPVAVGMVLVPDVKSYVGLINGFPTDPVVFGSAWIGKSGRYLNLDISLKTGVADNTDDVQKIGVAYNGSVTLSDGKRQHILSLVHSQNNVPEYYSVQTYVSIPLYRLPFAVAVGDVITLNVNTYKGDRAVSLSVDKLDSGEPLAK